MTIRFTRGHGKRDTLAAIRDDGTTTWAPLPPNFVTHDFMHFALETALGYRHAFYGLVGGGMAIEAFGEADPKTGRKPRLPAEAVYAETTVQTLWQHWLIGDWPEAGALSELLEIAWPQFGIPPPPRITAEQLRATRDVFDDVLRQWEQVLPGRSLELSFPL